MIKYAGSALTKDARGRYTVKPRDRLYRRMRFLTPNGIVILDVEDSDIATTISKYMHAVQRYARKGEHQDLVAFRGKSIRINGQHYPFVTDLDLLDELGRRGELRFEDIYAYTT